MKLSELRRTAADFLSGPMLVEASQVIALCDAAEALAVTRESALNIHLTNEAARTGIWYSADKALASLREAGIEVP